MLNTIEFYFQIIVQYSILLMECVGVIILLFTTAKSIWGCIIRDSTVRLILAKGIALALEFKLGGEVLRTVIVREWSEMAILGAVILLRGALRFDLYFTFYKSPLFLECNCYFRRKLLTAAKFRDLPRHL